MINRICGAIAIALLVAVAAGCGSSNSSSDNAPTKAEFLQKGNAICKSGGKEIDAKGKALFGGGKKPSPAQLQQFAKEDLIPGIQKQVDGIDNLTPPKGDEAKVNAIVASANADLKQGKANPKLLLSDKSFQRTDKLANAYGLKACGSSG